MTTNIDYSTLSPSRLEDWAAALGNLLIDASECLRSGEQGCRQSSMSDLTGFIEWNQYQSLDKIAADTIQDLIGASVNDALNAIGERSAALQRLTKDIRAVSSGARKDAASIRMEKVSKVLDASTNAIRSFQELREALKNDANAKDLVKKLEDLVKKTQALRDELEREPGNT